MNNRVPPGISLPAALDSARRAVTNSPEFGFRLGTGGGTGIQFRSYQRALEALDKA